jgi:hypothetical protein
MLTTLADGYRRHRFAWLFCSLILTITASPALRAIVPRINVVELLLAVNLAAVVATVGREHGMGWLFWVGGAFLALRTGEFAMGIPALVPFTYGLWLVACVLGMLATVRHALRSGTVDAERIFAALDAYLLAGLLFGVCYWLLGQIDAAAFKRDRSVPFPRHLPQLRDHRDARVWRHRAEERAGAEPGDRRGSRRPDVPRRPDRPAGESVLTAGRYVTAPRGSPPWLPPSATERPWCAAMTRRSTKGDPGDAVVCVRANSCSFGVVRALEPVTDRLRGKPVARSAPVTGGGRYGGSASALDAEGGALRLSDQFV